MESNPELREEFKRKEVSLNRLSLIPVWIRTEKKVHQTTMFDLYERYILNQMQKEVHNFAQGENVPEVTFLFGGYDWC